MFLFGVIVDQIFPFWGMVPDWPCSVADFSICHNFVKPSLSATAVTDRLGFTC